MDSKKTLTVIEALVYGLLVFGAICFFIGYASGGEPSCTHDPNALEFWDDYRIIPARVRAVDGNEIVVATSDKRRVHVLTLHMDKQTKPNTKPQKGCDYAFGYCVKCYYLHGYQRI